MSAETLLDAEGDILDLQELLKDGGTVAPKLMGYSRRDPFARSASTAAYGANDVVGPLRALRRFTNFGPSNALMVILGGALQIRTATNPGVSYTLHLYSEPPRVNYTDQDTHDVVGADMDIYVGTYALQSPSDLGSMQQSQVAVNQYIQLGASGHLWYYLVESGVYTPAANTIYVPTLFVMPI